MNENNNKIQTGEKTEVKYIDQGKQGTTKVIIITPPITDIEEAKRNTEAQCRAIENMLANVYGVKWEVTPKRKEDAS